MDITWSPVGATGPCRGHAGGRRRGGRVRSGRRRRGGVHVDVVVTAAGHAAQLDDADFYTRAARSVVAALRTLDPPPG